MASTESWLNQKADTFTITTSELSQKQQQRKQHPDWRMSMNADLFETLF